MKVLLNIWCDNQLNVKSCPIDQKTIRNQAKLSFTKLKEKVGDGCNETFGAINGWFDRFKKRSKWHSIETTDGEAASADKAAASSFAEQLRAMIE